MRLADNNQTRIKHGGRLGRVFLGSLIRIEVRTPLGPGVRRCSARFGGDCAGLTAISPAARTFETALMMGAVLSPCFRAEADGGQASMHREPRADGAAAASYRRPF
jgi:hypothetical protein